MRSLHGRMTVAVLLWLAACGPSRPPVPPGGMMPGADMDPASVEFTAIRMLLSNYQKLRFNGAQRTRLEAIQDTLVAANRELAARIRELMPERPEGRRGGGAGGGAGRPNREAMRRAMEEARPLFEEMQRNEDEAVRKALEVFNRPQREVARDLLEDYRQRPRRPGMGRSGGRASGPWSAADRRHGERPGRRVS